MGKQVLFRDRQELQAADLNNSQDFAAQALRHLVQDAVSNLLWFTGLEVTATSTSEVEVAAGRLYAAGERYSAAEAVRFSLFPHLPLVTRRVVALVAWGQAEDTDVQPRDFLLDLTTGETQPEAVAMERRNRCNLNLLAGAESADPQAPAMQSDTLAIALITLTPAGIERIEMNSAARLPRLDDLAARTRALEAWRALADPQIGTIASDLAALSARTSGLADRDSLIAMALDVARLKEQLDVPEGSASYGSDSFADEEQTDPGLTGATARIENGLLFPFAAQAQAPLELFNPYDASVKRYSDGLVLPAHSHQMRLFTEGYAGDLSVSQYQFQTTELKEFKRTVRVFHHGWHWNYSPSWYRRHFHDRYWYYDNYRNDRRYWKYYCRYGYYTRHQETYYELQQVTNSINGAVLAQTLLTPNSLWLTRLALYFTQVAADGDVHLLVCDTDAGKPVPGQTLTRVTLPAASLQKYPAATLIDVPPVLLEAGKRYAIMLITQGDHRVAVVSGNNYTQGTLFYGTDGDYMQGDLTRDLMFGLYGASFSRARTEVALQSVSLAGGITDVEISAQHTVPDGCSLSYEVQVAGRWYPLDSTELRLLAAPPIVPLRAVLLGTSDLAPALVTGIDAVRVSRPDEALVHYSSLRSLAAAASALQVHLVVSAYDSEHHSLNCQLVSGGTTYNPTGVEWRAEPDDADAQRAVFTFAPSPAISSYQVKISASRQSGSAPFTLTERLDVAL